MLLGNAIYECKYCSVWFRVIRSSLKSFRVIGYAYSSHRTVLISPSLTFITHFCHLLCIFNEKNHDNILYIHIYDFLSRSSQGTWNCSFRWEQKCHRLKCHVAAMRKKNLGELNERDEKKSLSAILCVLLYVNVRRFIIALACFNSPERSETEPSAKEWRISKRITNDF